MTLREELFALSDARYREFSRSLLPGSNDIIGVRLPVLRRIARRIARGDWRTWLDRAETVWFEERMLQGMVIRYARCTPRERLDLTARFIPLIDNWSLCDSFCVRLPEEERETAWQFIRPYFSSGREYDVRFAAVTALVNFIDPEHLEELFELLGSVRHEGYYARMGVAWAFSVCIVRFPERTLAWIRTAALDDTVRNKALQKAVESLRATPEIKAECRRMKRPVRSGSPSDGHSRQK